MKDWTGRWSHWSDPNQFVAGEPLAAGILDDLRITEVMYNPADADTTKGELEDDYPAIVTVKVWPSDLSKPCTDHLTYIANVAFAVIFKKVKSLTVDCVLKDRCISPLKGHITSLADTGVQINSLF